MRNSMKVLLAAVVLALGMSVKSEAAGSNRGAKGYAANNYTTTISTLSYGPSVVYGVIMSSVTTAGDYTVLWDSGSATGYTIGVATGLIARLIGSTSSQYIVFDPPLQLKNGIAIGNSAATNAAVVIYEKGRVTQGY